MQRIQFSCLCLLITALLFLPTIVLAQEQEGFKEWDEPKYTKANTAAMATYLTEEEKQVIYLMNLARINGPLFEQTYLKKYLEDNDLGTNKWVKSLKRDLKALQPMEVLKPVSKLCQAAKYHASDIGKKGKFSHRSTNGQSPEKRLKRFGFECCAENLDAGNEKAIDIVMKLLIDEGIDGVGHRKNILDSEYHSIGVSIQKHKKYGYCCVQDFSCD